MVRMPFFNWKKNNWIISMIYKCTWNPAEIMILKCKNDNRFETQRLDDWNMFNVYTLSITPYVFHLKERKKQTNNEFMHFELWKKNGENSRQMRQVSSVVTIKTKLFPIICRMYTQKSGAWESRHYFTHLLHIKSINNLSSTLFPFELYNTDQFPYIPFECTFWSYR